MYFQSQNIIWGYPRNCVSVCVHYHPWSHDGPRVECNGVCVPPPEDQTNKIYAKLTPVFAGGVASYDDCWQKTRSIHGVTGVKTTMWCAQQGWVASWCQKPSSSTPMAQKRLSQSLIDGKLDDVKSRSWWIYVLIVKPVEAGIRRSHSLAPPKGEPTIQPASSQPTGQRQRALTGNVTNKKDKDQRVFSGPCQWIWKISYLKLKRM